MMLRKKDKDMDISLLQTGKMRYVKEWCFRGYSFLSEGVLYGKAITDQQDPKQNNIFNYFIKHHDYKVVFNAEPMTFQSQTHVIL